jgi:pimeloyl-ACP methyl ester carboxylesterase
MPTNYYYSLNIHGQIINYYMTGEGPCLIFLHGYMENHLVWLPVAEKLTGYSILIPKMPDLSTMDNLEEENSIQVLAGIVHHLALHLGFKNYTVIGGSMGGYIALQMLRQHSSYIEKLVLVSTNPFRDTLKRKESRRKEIALLKAGKKNLIVKLFLNSLTKERLRNLYQLMVARLTEESLIALQKGMMKRTDSAHIFFNPPCNLYFMWGEDDITLPLNEIKQLLKDSTGVIYKEVKGGTHFLVAEQPGEVAGFITLALDK